MTVSQGAVDRVALVTGASSGIGAALARELAGRGVTVGIVARREDRLVQVLADCRRHTPASRMWVADLEDPATAVVVTEALDAFGHIDVLVNNAGIPKRRHVTVIEPAEVERVMQVNFHAPVRLSLAVLPSMLERGSGTIVNVSSLGGRLGIVHETAYCASKFALCGWSEAMALDLWDTPVKIKLVLPGPVATEIWDVPDNDPAAFEIDKVPAEEVAAGIADAIDSEAFEHYLPDMKGIALYKADNIDEFLAMVSAARPKP